MKKIIILVICLMCILTACKQPEVPADVQSGAISDNSEGNKTISKEDETEKSDSGENTGNDNSTEMMEYTYDNIKGLYTYTSETRIDTQGNEFNSYYYLYLYENGTFNYRMGTAAPYGYMGNYIIKDNTIVLNYLFSTNSGAGIYVTTGSKTITITAEDTLIDAKPTVPFDSTTKVTLKKASSKEASEFSQSEDFSYILENYEITNNAPNY